MTTKEILAAVRDGKLNIEQAALQLKLEPFQEMGFAKIDHHRALRQGSAEVIYGASKTPEQIASIAAAMAAHGGKNILITRMHPEAEEVVRAANPSLWYDPLSRIGIVNKVEYVDTDGYIVVASGGTSDQPVCEEAALTAEAMGNRVVRKVGS